MEVTFVDPALAAVCNSRSLMERRWGTGGFRHIARRLLELRAAADIGVVATLPGVTLEPSIEGDAGGMTVSFDHGRLVIAADLREGPMTGHAISLHIVTLHVAAGVTSP